MKIGLFMMPLHTPKLSYNEMYKQDVEAALFAEELNYDEFWIGEHTTTKVEPVSNALQFLSCLAPQTSRIKLCTGVVNLPHHHPARVAADAAMLDHLCDGRLILGIGPGGLASDFELFGTTDKNRQEMMTESADLIRAIWEGDAPFDLKGKHWSVKAIDTYQPDMTIGLFPKPLQNPFPTFCTSAMSPYSGTAKLAGVRGWNLISANFNAPWIVRSQWAAFEAGAKEAGRKADPASWRVARSILVTETDQQARDYLATPDNAIRSYYNYLFTQLSRAGAIKIFMMKPDTQPEEITLEKVLDSMVIAGSARTVTEKLASFRDEVGPFGGLLCTFHEWDQKQMWKSSMRRMIDEVLPAIDRHTPKHAMAR
jgi:alkanesulfonate monooxygenase SsuD/methylene tetrahydromethanopterin reductase-like flavin-dependent oxidoreductase (luciferase family)